MKWLAIIWLLALYFVLYGLMYTETYQTRVVLLMTVPYTWACLLGIWLAAGSASAVIRLLGTIAVSCLLVGPIVHLDYHPTPFSVGLATATSVSAILTLMLGSLNAMLPVRTTWQVRFALWEVVVSVTLLAFTFAWLKELSELTEWQLKDWPDIIGGDTMALAAFTSVLVVATLLPVSVLRARDRWIGWGILLVTLAALPILECITFHSLYGTNFTPLFFYQHNLYQAGLSLAVLIPFTRWLPGVLLRETPAPAEPVEANSPVDPT
ncbi:hypothetical protein [Bremerella cremea]|uniref:hypothetical protein n=1 Tax=Bremerella cremea TaxID=1031537 RepID=UPI0031E6EBAC